MSPDAFDGAKVHEPSQAGEYLVVYMPGPDIDWKTNFSPEVRKGLRPLMTRLVELATVQPGESQSFLTETVIDEFEEVVQGQDIPDTIEFAHIVFSSLIDTYNKAIDPPNGFPVSHEHLKKALVWMLANAGSEGTGAACNLTSRYLRTARHNFLHPRRRREYDDIGDAEFEKGHRVLSEPGEEWHEEGLLEEGEFEDALKTESKAKLFVMICLGRLFTRRVQASVRQAAEIIAEREDFKAIQHRYPHILGPLNRIRLFHDVYGFLEEMHRFVNRMAGELGILDRVSPQE